MIATDHFLSQGDLEQIGDRIRTGQSVHYPEEAVQEYIKLFEENPGIDKLPARIWVGCIVVVVLVAAAIGLIVWIVGRS